MMLFTTLYFSEEFTMMLNLIIFINLFKNIYRTYHVPGTVQNAGEALGARPAWPHLGVTLLRKGSVSTRSKS